MYQPRDFFRVLAIIGLVMAVAAMVFSIGCNNQPDEISAEIGETTELKIGQTVAVEGEQIKLKFVEITGDSRCATGVECFWEGEVTVVLEITYQDESFTKTVTQPGLTSQMSADIFKEYEISFNVLPYPELNKEIKADDYRLELMINK